MSQPLSQEQFLDLKNQGYSHVPLIKKRLMDDATPVSVFANIRKLNPKAYLFESVVGGERFARYSMIGLGKGVYFEYQDGVMKVGSELVGVVSSTKTDQPFDEIRKFMAQFTMPTTDEVSALPVFSGGLVGYLRSISGLQAFAGRRPALLVVRLGVVLRPIAPGADLLWIGSGLLGRR